MVTTLHSSQKEVVVDTHPYRVVCCGRQWGKTTLTVLEMVALARSRPTRIAYFATTYDQARNIAWTYLKELSKPLWVKQPNESRLEIQIASQDGGVSEISLRGFENIETVRGQQFDLVVIDEVASLNNWKYNWEAILEPTLAFRHGTALFVSTPKGFNHFYDMYNEGMKDSSLWKSWKFTSYDNPYLDSKRVDKARQDNSPEYFAQEYMADFRSATGKAHKAWDRTIHLVKPFEIPKTWQYARGFDFGSADNTTSIRWAVFEHGDHSDFFIDKIYKDNRRTTSDHANAILAQDFGKGFIPKWGDPTGAQWFKDMEMFKVFIMPASKETKQGSRTWIENCIERVNELLEPRPGHTLLLPDGNTIENAPKLFVFDTAENNTFVQEIEKLKWRETSSGEILPLLDDSGDPTGHFDLMAALRYLAVSWKPQGKFSGGVSYQNTDRKWGVYDPRKAYS
jgi:hypothetical protein